MDKSDNVDLPLLLLKHACRIWDSPILLAAVWFAAAMSSAAVLVKYQWLAESLDAGCNDGGGMVGATPNGLAPFAHQPVGGLRGLGTPLQGSGGMMMPTTTLLMRAVLTASPMVEALQQLAPGASPSTHVLALATVLRIGENLQLHPGDPQYARLFKENPTFVKALGGLHGSNGVMQALGFSEDHEIWEFQATAANLERLQAAMIVVRTQKDKMDRIFPV